jgi:hypothetical protein
MLKMHINMINDLMTGQKPVRFNRHMNRLYIDLSWGDGGDLAIGDYIIIEAFRMLDADTYTDVYSDYFLLAYTTALIKRQWGVNLKKFEGVQLPGGVTLNGQKIFDEAQEEIKQYPAGAVGTYLKTIVTIIVCSLSITFIFTISSLGSLVTILSQSCLIAVIISSVKGSNNRSHTMLPNCGDIKRSPLRV